LPAGGVANGAPLRATEGPQWGMGGVSTMGLFAATGPAEQNKETGFISDKP